MYTTELAIWGIVTLVFVGFKDLDAISSDGLFRGWSVYTLIPVTVNALGGILVGLVVRYAGGVRKGFGTVAGMFLTAVFSYFINSDPFTITTWVSLPLLIASVYIHSVYPYQTPKQPDVEVGPRDSTNK